MYFNNIVQIYALSLKEHSLNVSFYGIDVFLRTDERVNSKTRCDYIHGRM